MGQLHHAHLGMEIVHTVKRYKQTQCQVGMSPSDVTRQRQEQRQGQDKESCNLDNRDWKELGNKFLMPWQPERPSPSQAGARRHQEPGFGWANTDAGAEWEHRQPELFLTTAEEAFTFHYQGETKCPSAVRNLFPRRVGVEGCEAPSPGPCDQQL